MQNTFIPFLHPLERKSLPFNEETGKKKGWKNIRLPSPRVGLLSQAKQIKTKKTEQTIVRAAIDMQMVIAKHQ